MRSFRLSLSSLAAVSLLARASHAQPAPVKLLVPARVEVRVAAPAEALGQTMPPKAAAATSQPAPAPRQARPVMPQPLYLVNSHIIIGVGGLNNIRPQNIANIVVYKGEDMPAAWRTATANGVINLTLKPGVKLRSVPLARLKRRQHLTGPVRFELEGRPLTDASLRIDPAAIGVLEVRSATAETAYSVLNIKLLVAKPQPSNYPPGTIFVRGVAAR